MKKIMLAALALLLTVALAGCGADDKPRNDVGNFYEYYTVEELADGGCKVKAEAHWEDVLPLIYFNAAEETVLQLDCNFLDASSNIQLFYVYEDEQGVQEKLIFEQNADSGHFSAELADIEIDVAVGESHLEWRTANSRAALLFELILPDVPGVDYAMRSAEDQAEWDAMMSALDNQDGIMEQLSEQLGEIEGIRDDIMALAENNSSLSGTTIGVQNREMALAAGENFAFVSPKPQEACTLGLFVWLAEPQGDLQLVYVQPDGAEQVLWDSEGQDEWIINLVIDMLPGEGRLEWRSENGCECKLNMIVEHSEAAGVTGFSS